MINLETPKKFRPLIGQAHTVAQEVLRPIARKYDTAEHERPKELDFLAAILNGMSDSGATSGAGAAGAGKGEEQPAGDKGAGAEPSGTGNGSKKNSAISLRERCWGDAGQQATYLPAFTGEDVAVSALAILEPRPLFDPFALRTTARRVGDGYVLDGEKSLVPRAAEAHLFLVAAELEDRGPALFLVEGGAAGITTIAEPAMGARAAATATISFAGVTLPATALLADADQEVYAECIHRARLAWCAVAVGAAQAALDYLIPYVNERIAFGEPIANRQAVAFQVSDIAIETAGMRLATWRAASRADAGKDFFREAAVARQLCVTHGAEIGSAAVQLLGGHGYTKEYPVERWYRDLRTAGVYEGALLV
jgi:alkylation response protein AidB-like acyl-CoA dehydrogenase